MKKRRVKNYTEEGALIGEIVVRLRLRDGGSDDHKNYEDYNRRSPCVHRSLLHRLPSTS